LQNIIDTESDSEEEDTLITFAIGFVKDCPVKIVDYVEKVVHNYTRSQFQQNFRLTVHAFNFLQQKMSTAEEFEHYSYESIQQQLLAFVWVLATPESYR
jgi:hypothetical protein